MKMLSGMRARLRARGESGMETAQVILILGIVVGLIAILFPAISGVIRDRGDKAQACISNTNMNSTVNPEDC